MLRLYVASFSPNSDLSPREQMRIRHEIEKQVYKMQFMARRFDRQRIAA